MAAPYDSEQVLPSPLIRSGTHNVPNHAGFRVVIGAHEATSSYSLACFDDAGGRHYWVDDLPTLAGAPALVNPRVYVADTLTILRRRF